MSIVRLHWSVYFLIITVGIIVLGAVFGAFAFVLFGLVTGAQFTLAELARNGAQTLGFYFMLWAPGIALVLCVKRTYERRRNKDGAAAARSE